MYAAVLFLHSWLRYVVVGFGLWLLVLSFRGMRTDAPWSPHHERVHARFSAALDVQLLLGLALYFLLSPISAAAFADFGAAMKNAQLRFFGVEHFVGMLLAVAIAHVGRVRAKRKQARARHRTTFIAQALWLVLTLASIPWPGLDVGRPLFRF